MNESVERKEIVEKKAPYINGIVALVIIIALLLASISVPVITVMAMEKKKLQVLWAL